MRGEPYLDPCICWFIFLLATSLLSADPVEFGGDYVYSHSGIRGFVGTGWETTQYNDASFVFGWGSSSKPSDGGLSYADWSAAIGLRARVEGFSSFAFGTDVTAFGSYSFAMGRQVSAEHAGSFALGALSTSTASEGFTVGYGLQGASYRSVVVGSYNTLQPSISDFSWHSSEPIFIVGNGESSVARSDALVVKKNGDVIIPKRQGDISMGPFTD